MGTLILILLLLAALTGVFWTVLKVTAVTILSLVLTIMVLAYIGVWYARRRWNRFVNDPNIQRVRRGYEQAQRQTRGERPPAGPITAEGRKEPDEPLPP